MNLPSIYNFFDRQNEENVEKQDLTYQIFKDLDYTKLVHKTSFYRSDFRGSKFENITFYQNNFDIADFINNIFFNVEFKEVQFGEAEFKNCVFQKCFFKENSYVSASFTNCTFLKCDFSKEEFRLDMKDCIFKDCTFRTCVFDQCSTDTIEFNDCVILKCELSTMHAENYKIINCIFRDTYLGINFLGTYLIKGTDFNLLSFKYRGEIVSNINNNFFSQYTHDMFEHSRYYEYLNLLIIFHSKCNLEDELVRVIKKFNTIENENLRMYTIKSIFEMLEFYFGSDCLSISTTCSLLTVLEQYKNIFSDDEKLNIECGIFRIENLIASSDMSFEYLLKCDPLKTASAELTFATDDIEEAKTKVDNLICKINQGLADNFYHSPYIITSIKKGSVIITIASSLLLILLAAKVSKNVCHTVCKMKIEIVASKKVINSIEISKTATTMINVLKNYSDFEKIIEQDDLGIENLTQYIIQLTKQ